MFVSSIGGELLELGTTTTSVLLSFFISLIYTGKRRSGNSHHCVFIIIVTGLSLLSLSLYLIHNKGGCVLLLVNCKGKLLVQY